MHANTGRTVRRRLTPFLLTLAAGCNGFPPAGPHERELAGRYVLESIDGVGVTMEGFPRLQCGNESGGDLSLATHAVNGPPGYEWSACGPSFGAADYGDWSERDYVVDFVSRRVPDSRYRVSVDRSGGVIRLSLTNDTRMAPSSNSRRLVFRRTSGPPAP